VRAPYAALAVITLLAGLLAATVLSRPGSAAQREPVAWATLAVSRSILLGGGVYVLGKGANRLVAPGGSEPAWSPDGRRLAYVGPGIGGANDVFVADADGTHVAAITQTGDAGETSPGWSPDGRRLVFEQNGAIVVLRADGSNPRILARGREPSWSPGGTRIAFEVNGDLFLVPAAGGRPRPLTSSVSWELSPAWSPDGRHIAFVSDEGASFDVRVLDLRQGATASLTADEFDDSTPTFSADGRRVLFASARAGVQVLRSLPLSGGTELALAVPALSEHPATRPRPAVVELLPDLEQRPPADLSVKTVLRGSRKRFLLGFDSATDNVGLGPVIIAAKRESRRTPFMRGSQIVGLASRGRQTLPRVGILRYVYAPTHSHWHVMGFQRYELRRADDNSVVFRDRKSGFCLADHYAHAPGVFPNEPRRPVFKGYCEQGRPKALSVYQGTSVGYTDRYPSHFHGQNLDLTRVPAGTYVLVHRANRNLLFRELRYENNAASLRIRIDWPRGRAHPPAVRVLRTCPHSERC
jgi:Lysyl oxidase/WD40-like Beta Propeller Repeat